MWWERMRCLSALKYKKQIACGAEGHNVWLYRKDAAEAALQKMQGL